MFTVPECPRSSTAKNPKQNTKENLSKKNFNVLEISVNLIWREVIKSS